MIARSFPANSTHAKNALKFIEQGKKNHQLLLQADGTDVDTDEREGFVNIEVDGVLKASPDGYSEGDRSLTFSQDGTKFETTTGGYRTTLVAGADGSVNGTYAFKGDIDSADDDSTEMFTSRNKMKVSQLQDESQLKNGILSNYQETTDADNTHSDLDPRQGHVREKYGNDSSSFGPGTFEHVSFSNNWQIVLNYSGEGIVNVDSGELKKSWTNDQGTFVSTYTPEGYKEEYSLRQPEQFIADGGNEVWISQSEIRRFAGLKAED